jgi:hypothetical protein
MALDKALARIRSAPFLLPVIQLDLETQQSRNQVLRRLPVLVADKIVRTGGPWRDEALPER